MDIERTAPAKPAGTAGLPVVGSLPEFARDPIAFITRLQREFGDVAAFNLLGSKGVLLSHPKDIERVLVETGQRYGKGFSTFALRTVLGNGLVTSEGDFWKRQRKLMAPAFHHQFVKRYAAQMVAYTQDMLETWQSGSVRDLNLDMMNLTQRIIMKVLFDADVLDNAAEASRAFDAMMRGIGAEMSGPDAVLPAFVPTPARAQMQKGVRTINALLEELIAQRRAAGTTTQHDLLTVLMEARDEAGQPMTTEQLLDEIRSLYLAGHETTATTLSWTWHLLSHNPDAYAQVEAEIDAVLRGQPPTAEDVARLPYCNAVIKESMRCYPVAWLTRRVALEEVVIAGRKIDKGTSLFMSPWIVHRDARWYPEPEAFKPERWLQDKAAQPAREAYIPFGGGPHICIGNGLAMMEAVLLLATILQRYHVAVLPTHPVELGLAGTLRPKHGLKGTVERRGQ